MGKWWELSDDEKREALKEFKLKIIYEISEISILFKDRELSERTIKEIWKENLENYRVPLVISIGEYVYGLAGVYKTPYPKYIDRYVFKTPYVYKSVWSYFLVRDLFYFINKFYTYNQEVGKIIEKIRKNFIQKDENLCNAYSQFIEHYKHSQNELKSDKKELTDKEKLILMLQFLYIFLDIEEIEKLHYFLVKDFNESLFNDEKLFKRWIHDFQEYYDAFYFSYRDISSKNTYQNVYMKCFIITKYGIFQDISYSGKEIKDPVKLLSEDISKNIKKDKKFKIWISEEIEKYKYAKKEEDRIYEYIMEIDNLESGEFVENFSSSRLCELLLKNAIDSEILCGINSFEKFYKTLKKLDIRNLNKEIYTILMLIYGFEMPSVKIDINRLLPKNLKNKIEQYLKEIEGAVRIEERPEKIEKYFLETIKDLEYFLKCINPFFKLYLDYDGNLLKLIKEGKTRVKIKSKIKGDLKTLKDIIDEFMQTYREFIKKRNKERKFNNKLSLLNELRNKIVHVKSLEDYKISEKEFREIYKSLSEILDILNKDFSKFHLLKIEKIIEDCYARKYIKAKEYDGKEKKDWYIVFSIDEIYELVDPTFIYYVVPKTNPIACDPFILPAHIGFEILIDSKKEK